MFLANKLNMGVGSPAAPADAQFNYVTMLLHGDGTNGAQNNTFLDSSTNNFTITRNGNTTQGSFSPYSDNWSNYFPSGASQGSTAPSPLLFSNISLTSAFTVESWIYMETDNSGGNVIIGSTFPGTNNQFNIRGSTLKLDIYDGSGHRESTGSVTLNTWTHVAFVRDGAGNVTFYINGTSAGTSFTTATLSLTTIGALGGYGGGLLGYISNLRVTNTQVYTGSFTPSTTPLTAVTGTQLLSCQSNRFIDNSTNAYTITVNGTPSVQRFNPFGTSTAYDSAVIGGSGYFDGSGDYLTLASGSTFSPSGNYLTVEAWVYATGAGGDRTVFSRIQDGSPYSGYDLRVDGGTAVSIDAGGQTTTSSISCVANTWNYVVWQFDASGNRQIYVNGVRGANVTGASTSVDFNNTPRIGAGVSNGSNWAGYISNLRIIKQATAYYTTSTISVPTAPLTAVTNTQLLTYYTNGAIFDNAMINNLETVGNAQISTSVVKYGTGSIYFDGTGDSLSVLNTPTSTVWGTESWTIEGWIYPTAVSASYRTIYANGYPVQIYQRGGSVEIYISSTNGFSYIVNGLTGPASSVTADTWVHFAVVKNGNDYKVYVNGVGGSTVTDSTAIALTSTTNAIIGDAPFGSYPFVGYMDDLRITKGYARYTSTFTPPTAAFPNTGPI